MSPSRKKQNVNNSESQFTANHSDQIHRSSHAFTNLLEAARRGPAVTAIHTKTTQQASSTTYQTTKFEKGIKHTFEQTNITTGKENELSMLTGSRTTRLVMRDVARFMASRSLGRNRDRKPTTTSSTPHQPNTARSARDFAQNGSRGAPGRQI
ncbi:hypothetical protein BDA96_04G331700 [Sorghum bicolor]|uniref:Uncharacterized protein n=2 Tax=Sorghum bicolor TaxID=4558 RepID=C5XTM1_SORBI|nr:hypothetical protein SORBI_3004G310350 [Sorghum bicolor]KAG0535039.1 hypothetical protein BDA96_04G331700 [Sorghum bicolor]